jgi:hypothetical protein
VAARGARAAARTRSARQCTDAFHDPEGQARLLAFAQGLQQMGWAVGSNLRIDTRWGASDAERGVAVRGNARDKSGKYLD